MNRASVLALAAGSAALAAWFLSMNDEDGEELQTPSPLDSLTTSPDVAMMVGDPITANENAFLAMIGQAEGATYNTLYGGSTFSDFSDHPANRGWPGLPLTDQQCASAGFAPGCVSTAAGRYQINRPTWSRVSPLIAASDFSPAAQDAAAIYLIAQRGALGDVNAGNVEAAIFKCRKVWASFPGAGYAGQPTQQLATMLAHYQAAGGMLAA